MIKWIYKRIIRKFGLSEDQLEELKNRLLPENICKGPFVQGEKNCPNTTALAIREGAGKFKASGEVKKLMMKYGINSIELWAFYAIFDLSAILSDRYFRKSLVDLRGAVDELVKEK